MCEEQREGPITLVLYLKDLLESPQISSISQGFVGKHTMKS
jgi:hypothetical protein